MQDETSNFSLKDEEFKIIETPEDQKRSELLKIFNVLAEEEAREERLGSVVKQIENIHFETKELGQCLIYKQTINSIAFFELTETTEMFANSGKKINKTFDYPKFEEAMQIILDFGQVKSLRIGNCAEVFKFLKDNQAIGASLDLTFREKKGKVLPYFDIILNDEIVCNDVKVHHLDEACKSLNIEKENGSNLFEKG